MINAPKSDVNFANPTKRKNAIETIGKDEFALMKPHIKEYRTCLDIGAHIGLTALRFAKHFNTVHSFEPINYSFLVENTEHLSNVINHDCAVSNKNDVIEIYMNPRNSQCGIIPDEFNTRFIEKRYTNDNADFKDTKLTPVRCVTIDSFNFNDVDLIKIDVEGHILPVVEGMVDTLTNNSPVVQIEMFEVPDFKELNKKVHKIFQELGYNVVDTFSKGHQRDRIYCKGK